MASDPIRGSTLRWTYEDGPTKGTEFEHVFGTDGKVTYRMLGQAAAPGGAPEERPEYQVAQLRDGVWTVAYLAPSGWTLTTVLDMTSGQMLSFASNEKQLFTQRGRFEVVVPAPR